MVPTATLYLVALAALGLLALSLVSGCQPAVEFHADVAEPVGPAAEIAGPNWNGSPFRLSDHTGEVSVVMFGYTYCPDVCPITLSRLENVVDRLGEQAQDLNVVFVSVDPQRDSLEKLADYVPKFHPDFYGVYLEGGDLQQVKDGYSVVSKQRAGSNEEFYYVDHTSTLFVVDRRGDLRLKMPMDAPVEDMVADLQTLLGERSA